MNKCTCKPGSLQVCDFCTLQDAGISLNDFNKTFESIFGTPTTGAKNEKTKMLHDNGSAIREHGERSFGGVPSGT